MCHLQLSVDGQGSERGARGQGAVRGGRTTVPSHYKTVRSSANSVMVFVIGAVRMSCDDRLTTHGSDALFIRLMCSVPMLAVPTALT